MTAKRNKNGKPRKKRTVKPGALHFKYRHVAANQRRVIVRPREKPPRMYYVSWLGVFVHNNFYWDKDVMARLLAKGYTRLKTTNSQFIFERTVNNGQ